MAKPVRIALLVALWGCGSMLLPSTVSWAEPVGLPALPRPDAQFGGVYRRVLGDNPCHPRSRLANRYLWPCRCQPDLRRLGPVRCPAQAHSRLG